MTLILVNAGEQPWKVDDDHLFGWRKTTMRTLTMINKATTIWHSFSLSSYGLYSPFWSRSITISTYYPADSSCTSHRILANCTINIPIVTRHIECLGDDDHISCLPGDWIQQTTFGSIWNGWCQTLYQFSTIKHYSVVRLKDDQWLLWSSTAMRMDDCRIDTWWDHSYVWLMISSNDSMMQRTRYYLMMGSPMNVDSDRIQGYQLEINNSPQIRMSLSFNGSLW